MEIHQIKGSHDTAFILRLPPVIEAISLFAIADLYLFSEIYKINYHKMFGSIIFIVGRVKEKINKTHKSALFGFFEVYKDVSDMRIKGKRR